jgi:lipopolysaccharide biosynthesis protein
MQSQNQLIVVLGMHRSGTSAITRALKVFDVELGDRLMPPIEHINAKGFWEDVDINALNIEMMAAIDIDWDYLAPVKAEHAAILEEKGYLNRAVELLNGKVGNAHSFGLKEPRIAKLLPFWRKVFDLCGYEQKYVLALRNPLSVASSLAKRDGFEVEKSGLLWLDHVVTSLRMTAGKKRIIVDYDRLMSDPDNELRRISECLFLNLNRNELNIYKTDFLDEGLKHTSFNTNDVWESVAVPPLVKKIYSVLCDVASDTIDLDTFDMSQRIEAWAAELDDIALAMKLTDKYYRQLGESRQNLLCANAAQEELQKTVLQQDEQLSKLKEALEKSEKALEKSEKAREKSENINNILYNSLEEIRQSTSWKVTSPLRYTKSCFAKARAVSAVLPDIVERSGGLRKTAYKAFRVVRKEGWSGVKVRIICFVTGERDGQKTGSIDESKLSVVPYYIDPRFKANATPLDSGSVAVHLHLYYTDMLGEMVEYLNNIPQKYDLFVSVSRSTDIANVRERLKTALLNVERVIVEAVPNRGRDIAPLIVQFGKRLSQYDIFGHFHTKKSPHNLRLSDWCAKIFSQLMGPPKSGGGHVNGILELLQTDAKVVFPEGRADIVKDRSGWSANYDLARILLQKYTELSIEDFPGVDFPEGGMFWARGNVLRKMLELPLDYQDFPTEPIAADGTLAHALERLILVFASEHPGQCIKLHNGDSIKDYRDYEHQQDYSEKIVHADVKVLSFYLPQFHPIPENDLWHGKGFTEWVKVSAANPLFRGHYQQHIPHEDIGYYLLDSAETLRLQAEQMRKAGVSGQIFYHYWFSGKLILEEPAKLLLDTPDVPMPFCFCWANENWTRRWDGNESEILLGQNYSVEDAKDFIQYLIPFFNDSRYIKVENRPVLFIYRPSSIPEQENYLQIWEAECKKAGLAKPYVVAVLTRGATNPHDFGMDAGVERVLHDWTDGAVSPINDSLHHHWPINGSVLPYDDVSSFYMQQNEKKDFTYFRSLVPIWDNTARYGSEAYVVHGSTPKRFQEWMESLINYSNSALPADRRFVVVNAWNEWAEGAHLEPDSRYGYSYLNAVGRALSSIDYAKHIDLDFPIPSSTKVHIHLPEYVEVQLDADPVLNQRFIQCLSRSTVLRRCSISTSSRIVFGDIPSVVQGEPEEVDFVLEFRKVVLFDSVMIEKMLSLGCATTATVVPNFYDIDLDLSEVAENYSVAPSALYHAPLVLIPKQNVRSDRMQVKMRTDAHCFASYPSAKNKDRPVITTIMRFHKSGSFIELKNALFCLYAMKDCFVIPFIAAQDLNERQISQLKSLLGEFAWPEHYQPITQFYHSENGQGDLRSRMLNESLKSVATRYAAFLDFDDLLTPNAYSLLLSRLQKTGKAISFGRVYSTSYDSIREVLIERKKVYEYGYSYEDFLQHNHAPLHSFMLDMRKIDLNNLIYFDDQRYMEDYFLTLQIFDQDNCDWDGLKKNSYIGDYIHSIDRTHTLAIADQCEREKLLISTEYKRCEKRISELQTIKIGLA